MEPDQPRLGASVMTHISRHGRSHTGLESLEPAEPTRLLAIASSSKPIHRPKADKVLWLPHATGPAPFGAKETLPVPTRRPRGSARFSTSEPAAKGEMNRDNAAGTTAGDHRERAAPSRRSGDEVRRLQVCRIPLTRLRVPSNEAPGSISRIS